MALAGRRAPDARSRRGRRRRARSRAPRRHRPRCRRFVDAARATATTMAGPARRDRRRGDVRAQQRFRSRHFRHLRRSCSPTTRSIARRRRAVATPSSAPAPSRRAPARAPSSLALPPTGTAMIVGDSGMSSAAPAFSAALSTAGWRVVDTSYPAIGLTHPETTIERLGEANARLRHRSHDCDARRLGCRLGPRARRRRVPRRRRQRGARVHRCGGKGAVAVGAARRRDRRP